MARPKILIVDDEPGICELLGEVLTDEGYAVLTAQDADTAWQIRQRESLSLILLDIWMPDKDGLVLLKQWRDSGFLGVPVIIMSGHATIDTAVEAMKLGACEILEKPIAANRLLGVVNKVVRREKQEQGSAEIRQTDFGKTPTMQKFKSDLLEVSIQRKPTIMVGATNAGAAFYARLLATPHGDTIFINNGIQLEASPDSILRRASNGLVIIRLLDMLNPLQQSGLLALMQVAAKKNMQVVASSSDPAYVLERRKKFNKKLFHAFTHSIHQPSLSEYYADIPYTADIITHQLTKNADAIKSHLSAPAVALLAAHHYQNGFLELLTLIRYAFMNTMLENMDRQSVQMAIDQFAGGHVETMLNKEDIFSMKLREARDVFEEQYFRQLMSRTEGDIQQATKISGLERTYLYRKIKKYKED